MDDRSRWIEFVGSSDEDTRERQARWIESIDRAFGALILDVSVDRNRRFEIEDQLLRDLGVRAPTVMQGQKITPSAGTDRAYRYGVQSTSRMLRYTVLLLKQPGVEEKLERLNSGETDVDLKRETWAAGFALFKEIGGGMSPVHVRLTLQKWSKAWAGPNSEESTFPLPLPIGDPPL